MSTQLPQPNRHRSPEHIRSLLISAEPSRRPLDQASTLPPSLFDDPEWFGAEQDRVFFTGWVAVGRSADVAEPASYLTASVAGEPVIVVRDKVGGIRALSNVCRHRSTTIIEGAGSAASLSCPHHQWTYRLDGTLLHAPSMQEASNFDLADHCLAEFRLADWNGWLLVNLDSRAASPHALTPTLDALLEGERIAEMRSVGVRDCPSPWNWKISIENFLESYHHRGTHPETLEPVYPGDRSFVPESGEEPWSAVDHVSVVDDQDPFIAIVRYPSLAFAVLRGIGMAWFRLTPEDVNTTSMQIEVFTLPEHSDDPGIGVALLDALDAVNREDVRVNRRTAQGLRSRFARPGRISHLEAATWHFRRWLLACIDDRSPGTASGAASDAPVLPPRR